MLSVAIHKDIAEYQPKVIGKLTGRTLISITVALGLSVAVLLDPYMTYEGEDYCKHIVAGFLGDRDLDWASGYIDEEKIKNGQVMPADLKSALSMALDNELSTSWAYLDALSSQCAEIFNKFAEYIESAGLASGVLVPGEYELDSNALNADVSERFNIQYGFQCDQISVYSSCLSRCTGRMTHLRLSRRISVSRTPAVLSSTIALRSPAIPRMNSWT